MLKLISIAKNSKGISLVEVIIAMAIGLIGTLGSYALLASVHGSRAENLAVVQAQGEARNVMERITRELRESSAQSDPQVVWPNYANGAESYWIYFLTPRNMDREFMVNDEGEPEWQRGIQYWLNSDSNILYRYQFYLTFDPENDDWSQWFNFEVVSKNVEHLGFTRHSELNFSDTRDMVTINIRTFADNDDKIGNVARSYADLRTTVKLRN